jgi:hypothetical protein
MIIQLIMDRANCSRETAEKVSKYIDDTLHFGNATQRQINVEIDNAVSIYWLVKKHNGDLQKALAEIYWFK